MLLSSLPWVTAHFICEFRVPKMRNLTVPWRGRCIRAFGSLMMLHRVQTSGSRSQSESTKMRDVAIGRPQVSWLDYCSVDGNQRLCPSSLIALTCRRIWVRVPIDIVTSKARFCFPYFRYYRLLTFGGSGSHEIAIEKSLTCEMFIKVLGFVV